MFVFYLHSQYAHTVGDLLYTISCYFLVYFHFANISGSSLIFHDTGTGDLDKVEVGKPDHKDLWILELMSLDPFQSLLPL